MADTEGRTGNRPWRNIESEFEKKIFFCPFRPKFRLKTFKLLYVQPTAVFMRCFTRVDVVSVLALSNI